jgi:hypothetical protein
MLPEQKEILEEFLQKMRDLLIKKGHDYSGEEDTLKNFRVNEDIGIPTELSIFTRLSDKYMRLKNFFKQKELKVEDEKIEDTLVDLANYAALLYLARKENFLNKRSKI